MKIRTRVVLDTNVIISGLYGSGQSPPSILLHFAREHTFTLLMSAPIMEELEEVLQRAKIRKMTHMTDESMGNFLNAIASGSVWTEENSVKQRISRDIKDDKFLACAAGGQADYLVTGDKDLLVLKEYEGTKILTPTAFFNILGR